MKKLLPILIIILILVSCTSTATELVPPTTTPITQTPIPSFIMVPSLTSSPTVTPTLTTTPTPSLPNTIQFEFDEAIPENIIELVKTTVNQAYWHFVALGCSPDFHNVVVKSKELAGNFGPDGINVGWDDLTQISPNMDVRISHEMAHVMCEIQLAKDVNIGGELEWLFEGTANYFADEERLINTEALSGWQGNVIDHEIGMAIWVVNSKYCNYPFKSIEKDISPLGTGALAIKFPDFAGVGGVAAMLLAKTNPNGAEALLDYYKNIVNDSSDGAFQKAFGLTKDDFYRQFQNECEQGFPSIYKSIPMPTPSEGTIRLQGNTIITDGSLASVQYFIVPCKLKVDLVNANIDKCLSGIDIYPDGSFIIDLSPGYYSLSINSIDNGEAIGWYSNDGLVNEPICAVILKLDKPQSISITIDEENVTSC